MTASPFYIHVPKGKKVYFASDNHLGAPNMETSRIREKKFVAWLNDVKKDAVAIFLLGDLFDFWFEYKTVIPKGFTRTLGKLAEIADAGIPIHLFVGNHDLWMKGYFEEELGISVYHKPQEFQLNTFSFYMGHGDGLGPGDKGYKRLKKIFKSSFFNWLFRWGHPDIGMRIAHYFSIKNKLISGLNDAKFLGNENEWLIIYCKNKLKTKHHDFFVFGHRHLPLDIQLNSQSKYFNLGDWVTYYTYGVFDGKNFELKSLDIEKKNLIERDFVN